MYQVIFSSIPVEHVHCVVLAAVTTVKIFFPHCGSCWLASLDHLFMQSSWDVYSCFTNLLLLLYNRSVISCATWWLLGFENIQFRISHSTFKLLFTPGVRLLPSPWSLPENPNIYHVYLEHHQICRLLWPRGREDCTIAWIGCRVISNLSPKQNYNVLP